MSAGSRFAHLLSALCCVRRWRLEDNAASYGVPPTSDRKIAHASENSQRRLLRSSLRWSCQFCLELSWRQIAQRRVQAFLVIDLFQKQADGSASFVKVPVFSAINFLVLQSLHERLAGGVVVRIPAPAHADANTVSCQQVHVVAGGVLHALVGMMDQAGRGTPPTKCHAQSFQG